jgi:hypothetical protein
LRGCGAYAVTASRCGSGCDARACRPGSCGRRREGRPRHGWRNRRANRNLTGGRRRFAGRRFADRGQGRFRRRYGR